MKDMNKKSVLKVFLSTFLFLLIVSVASCRKDEAISTKEVADVENNQVVANTPKAADLDTISIKCKTLHVSDIGEIKARKFNGTITDQNGKDVPLTEDWLNIIYNAVDLTGFVEQQIIDCIDSM